MLFILLTSASSTSTFAKITSGYLSTNFWHDKTKQFKLINLWAEKVIDCMNSHNCLTVLTPVSKWISKVVWYRFGVFTELFDWFISKTCAIYSTNHMQDHQNQPSFSRARQLLGVPICSGSFASPAVTGVVTVFKFSNYMEIKRKINYTLIDENKPEMQLLKLSAEV